VLRSLSPQILANSLRIQVSIHLYTLFTDHESKHQAKYQLYGMSHHSGTLYGGHYIGEVQNLSTGKWYDCNDSWVKQIGSPDTESASCYVLFYVMTNQL
jgi:ubiquitin C-terminal hydrolase